MDIRRVILYSALALIIYSLWSAWQQDYPSTPITATTSSSNINNNDNRLLPNIEASNSAATTDSNQITTPQTVSQSSQPIQVKTDVLAVTIDNNFGDIVQARLLNYPVSVEERQTPITLLYDKPNQRYTANSSLVMNTNGTVDNLKINYTSLKQTYFLDPNEQQLVVTLKGQTDNGLDVAKNFIFTRGSYLIGVNYQIANKGQQEWRGYMNTQLVRTLPTEDQSSLFHIGSYTGASYSNPEHSRYKKVSFTDMNKANLNVDVTGGWIAMQQHYFLSAWVPPAKSKNLMYTRNANNDYTIGTISQPLVIKPGEVKETGAKLYIGPEITSNLKAISPGLDLTVDYGWLWFVSSALFSLMKAIHSVVGNWGWSIILVTVLIKLAFFRLSATSYKSMANMRKLQPKLQALRERYGDDKAKISQATMELYKQEKVNPLGGCLPILVQIPVFIALYWVLLESVELRQAPFIFWIKDLAAADPYHVLPIIMGVTMLIQQRLNPAPPDPTQAKIMMLLPIVFTALFWNFPSGLVLYWIVNNTLSILQQWYITRKYSDDRPASKKQLMTAK
ncbi:preprotein translocase YidC subunit [Legionella beliardensis]|uniref:Membrane protein insertase YidC n=1 Tax=Legionella beliardensis TaxID=91822 RepID=A0A378ID68_9GAMM|nr:membrane protein insertase YidC [Legionella beliardensis]STX30244.1 preprotein translocase YidC subunit [Legionella beliardensis]